MNLLIGLLVLANGLAVGVLLTLLIDGYLWSRFLNKAADRHEDLHEQHLLVAQELADTRATVREVRRHLKSTEERAGTLAESNATLQGRVVAAAVTVKTQGQELAQVRDRLAAFATLPAQPATPITPPEAASPLAEQPDLEIEPDTEPESETAAPEAAPADPPPVERLAVPASSSKLEAIRGIGPVYARRLREAGIATIADVAGQTPEALADIVGLKRDGAERATGWIAQAQTTLR